MTTTFKATRHDLLNPHPTGQFRAHATEKRLAVLQALVRQRPAWGFVTLPEDLDAWLIAQLKARRRSLDRSRWTLPLSEKNWFLPDVFREQFRGRTLVTSFNDQHPEAKHLYGASLRLDRKGRLCAHLYYGYARDESSWSVSYDDWVMDCRHKCGNTIPAKAAIGAELRQRRGESSADCLYRMQGQIEAHCVPATDWDRREARLREDNYQFLEHLFNERFRLGFDKCADHALQPDAGTRKLFSPAGPYFATRYAASLLADLGTQSFTSHAPHRQGQTAELVMLCRALATIRRLRPANVELDEFRRSISNRRYGAVTQPAEPPNYPVLRLGLKLARRQHARVLVCLPRGQNLGLIRVPLGQVRFDARRHRIRYRGAWHDIGVIRSIEAYAPHL